MLELDEFEDQPSGTVFRDVLMLTLIGFVAMVIMLLPHLSAKRDENRDAAAPGNVVVEIHWPNELPVDVDLWVQAPGDVPVGFWNEGRRLFIGVREVLGVEIDATGRNYEVSYSRGIPAGEYTVNVHMYGSLPAGVRVPVKVVVSVRPKYGELRQLLQTQIELTRRNQEETAFRFRLTEEGDLVPGSVTTLRRRLITAPSS
jgi:hypothetical protein